MLPLIEKYRPKSFDELVGVKDVERLKSLLESPKEMPNLLFYGPQGTGKTSTAKIIIKELEPIDVLRINGSDTTGVDSIRNQVHNFMISMSSQPDKPKLIWIEEFDYMSDSAFAALRSKIEAYMKNARFIVTLNYINKIPEPIQSRFSVFEFRKPELEDIYKRLEYIVEQEELNISDEMLWAITKKNRGDIRATLNMLQTVVSSDIDESQLAKLDDLAERVYQMIKDKQWSGIRYEIPQENPDYEKLLVDIDELAFEDEELTVTEKAIVNEHIARGLFEMSFVFNKDICFSAICSRIMKDLIVDKEV